MMTFLFPMDSKFYTGRDPDNPGQMKDNIIKTGKSFANSNSSGTGAFQVIEMVENDKLVLKRNDSHWDTRSPGNVKWLTIVAIREPTTRVAALLSGDVDLIMPVSLQDFRRIESGPDTRLVTTTGGRIIILQMNQNRVPAFRDPRVRKAVVYAINNNAIVEKIMRGSATVAAQTSPAGYPGHMNSLRPRYNLQKARDLMKEAGYSNGFEITMMAPNNRYVNDRQIAEAVAQMLARISIKVQLTTMSKAQYWSEFDNRSADMMMIG
jgi:peptide/nickel transport system substrate-binding protein